MPKLRTDSWAAALTEEQSWQLYYKARRCEWQDAVAWAVKEFKLERKPGRTAFYDWLGQMRGNESAHRLAQAATAAAEAAALAKTQAKDDALIGAYKAMAAELALRTGSAKEAQKFVEMATALADRQLHAAELDIKERSQKTKDAQLKLAREKFEAAEKRLNAVKDAVKTAKANGGGLSEEALAKIEQAVGML